MTNNNVIETQNLGRRYGSKWAVTELDLQIPKGAVFGFLGMNGAGKSTTIRMLMGLIRRHQGEVKVLGLDPAKEDVEIKSRTGYVAEQPVFYDWMKVEELCGFVAHYRKDRWDEQRAQQLLERFRIPRAMRMKELSKGQRAKTALVLAMAFDPELLILDEPTSGLDPVARREFVEGVLAEFQEEGKSIFVSSHLVNEIAGLVDHVGILHEGALLFNGAAQAFQGAVRKVRLSFKDNIPTDLRCEGMLKLTKDAREAVLSVYPFNEQKTVEELRAFAPADLQVEQLNLEDAFVEFVGGAERGTL